MSNTITRAALSYLGLYNPRVNREGFFEPTRQKPVEIHRGEIPACYPSIEERDKGSKILVRYIQLSEDN